MKLLRSILVCLFLMMTLSNNALAVSLSQTSSIHYVKSTPARLANCTDWDHACGLQDALDKAQPGDKIYVAAGTYLPTKPISSLFPKNSPTFNLETGVAIYGGFPAQGGEWGDRDTATHLTILSGEIGLPDDDSDNSFHVVTAKNVDQTAILDGFTIRDGRALGSVGGGGMYNDRSSPTLTNLVFSSNIAGRGGGGGMKNEYGSPKLINITFIDNYGYFGGGFSSLGGSPILTNVSFIENETEMYGGGMLNQSSTPTLINTTFSSNKAGIGGGISNLNESEPFLINVTFTGNSARTSFGGAIDNRNSSLIMTNVIVWGNTPAFDQIYSGETASALASYSIIEGGFAGSTNIDVNPLLNPLADNGGSTQTHALGVTSPAIGVANPSACPATDQRGHLRLVDGNGDTSEFCDIGAYEFGYSLILGIEGSGEVASTPDKADFFDGETVILTAVAAPGWAFAGWSGNAAGDQNPLVVTFNGNKTINASFKQTLFRYFLLPIYK